ncbi:hypothetical protein QQA45_06800 [Sneathia sanguinegens]|uniref:Uncharacterized protein n=1 Tax=Sneathia sanguinegens TaxID=40543 RepID=A0ABT7HMQ7_9FUSO|nr:hypothetical protein [Sneathia sanguinegens]MDK9581186.1 hypothetical protein [Sneathia sanguinegens]
MGAGNSGIYKNTKGALKPEHLMDELRRSGVKFTEEDIIAIMRQKNGNIAWLEKGNKRAGFRHILNEHEKDFKLIGIDKYQLPRVIIYAIKVGKIVGKQGTGKFPRDIYEIELDGKRKYIAITISKNGYIIGANPSKENMK